MGGRSLNLSRVGLLLAGFTFGAGLALAAAQQPLVLGAAADSQLDNDGAAEKAPVIRVGASAAGGDVGDAIDEPTGGVPVWERLQALGSEDKANAVIQLEPGSYLSRSELDRLYAAESQWNDGAFSAAIAAIRALEESGLGIAVGIGWRTPKAVDAGEWADDDVRIGTRTGILETALDYDAQNGNQFAVLRYSGDWSVNISTDGGQSWQETYTWGAAVDDVSAAVAGNYLWVGYVFSSINDQGRMRRFNVSDGSVDTVYASKTIFDKNVPIQEVAIATNADDSDDRVYYYAILASPAPVAPVAEQPSDSESGEQDSSSSAASQFESVVDAAALIGEEASAIKSEGAEVSAPVVPGSFDGDVRDLPEARPWMPGDPVFVIPEGQLPNGTGDGWDVRSLTIGAGAMDVAFVDEALDLGGAYDVETFVSGVSFGGIGFTSVAPPDTVGDVGPNHYIQMTNDSSGSRFQIWNKSGGTLAGPTVLDTLWTAGGACASGKGDPIVVYDSLADRWLMSEFAATGNHLCVYVSKTSNPVSGGWWLYDFPTPNFPDYPKYGVWPDGYYVSTYEGVIGAYVLERSKMLTGAAATSQRFTLANPTPSSTAACVNTRSTRALPSHLNGAAPPSGSPNFFFRSVEACQDISNPTDRLEIYDFHVDWTTPANSSFTLAQTLTPAGFSLVPCSPGIRDCIPQPGTTVKLDALSNRPLMHFQYRNFGGYETLVTNQAVNAGSGVSGVRWYELRSTGGGPWSIRQQGTYSPDGNGRWMGGIAMDGAGDMALGYSVSSSTVFPSIRYTGRLAGDPLSTMTEPEVTLMAGTGVQTWTQRWGDYSAMGVDPVDDCTFWYTQEYMPASGNWATHVGSFSFDTCGGTNLVYFWASGIDTTTPTWSEVDTGVANADRGLDAAWNDNYTSNFQFVSYIADNGGTNPVMVWRNDGSPEAITLLSDYTGTYGGTSVSAYNDTALVAYEYPYTNGSGIRYSISYNGGDSWTTGGFEPDVGHAFYYPDVTARGGQGTAIVYNDEAGTFDPVIFRYRDHYGSGAWDAEVAQINEFDVATARPNRIEWLPPSSASYAYGAIYISADPVLGTPYFDRSDISALGDELAVDFGANGLWHYAAGTWTKLTSWNAGAAGVAGWTGGVAADFDANGLYSYNGTSWTKLTGWNAENDLSGWSGGLAADFGANGVHSYDGTGWSKLTAWNAQALAGWSGGLAADFGANGLWNYDGTSWSKLTGWNAGSGGMSGWSSGLAGDFDANGLHSYDGASWGKLTTWNPEALTGWSGGLAADFGANGVYSYDGTSWSKLTGWNPGSGGLSGWSANLAGDFDANGVYSYDGTSWSKLTGWNAEAMDSVNLN